MAGELSRYRATEGFYSSVHPLPHARASRPLALRRRQVDIGDSKDVHVPATLISNDDPEARGGAHWRWRRSARAAAGGLAAAGSIPEYDQFERGAALELLV